MAHDHAHHHHQHKISNLTRAFVVGIVLNILFVIIEFSTGFFTNSLALLSDAGHNLSDVATLGLSLFAFQLSKRKANNKFTFGYHKSTILASLANAVILLLAVGSIGWEAIHRFMHPEITNGKVISLVAGVGIVINVVSALFFFREKENDLNIKGAYLHLMVDAMVSAGVVLAGIAIYYTHLLWIDPLISICIMAIVLYSTWGLLKESLRLSIDAVPIDVSFDKIKAAILQHKEVIDVHHLHIWAMSTTKNAMTAHLLVNDQLNDKEIAMLKQVCKHELLHLNIHHITFEVEKEICIEEDCH
jgi:cobalt-zinc-cadmium efflux system protein